jgi:hypothetical protein
MLVVAVVAVPATLMQVQAVLLVLRVVRVVVAVAVQPKQAVLELTTQALHNKDRRAELRWPQILLVFTQVVVAVALVLLAHKEHQDKLEPAEQVIPGLIQELHTQVAAVAEHTLDQAVLVAQVAAAQALEEQ